jgi:O-antigen/teichoic acid export membrane protein
VSLGNFLTTILMARALPPDQYGVFALIFGALIVLNTVHGALVTYPVVVCTAKAGRRISQQMATAALFCSLVISMTLAALGGVVALCAGQKSILLACIVALVAWQLQETTRAALTAHLRYSEAMLGDTLSYLGQATCIWVAVESHQASVNSALLITAATSALGAALQMWQLGIPTKFGRRVLRLLAARSWRDGRWLLGNRILGIWTAQCFAWTLAYHYGTASVGSFQALMNLLTFSHPILLSVGSIITSAVAGRSIRGRVDLVHSVAPLCVVPSLLLLPYFLTLFVAPRLALAVYYGGSSPHLEGAYLLRILVVSYVFLLAVIVSGATLSGVAQTGKLFGAQCAAAISGLLVGVPMTIHFGLPGAALGFLGVNIVHGTACMAALWRFLQSVPESGSGPVAETI